MTVWRFFVLIALMGLLGCVTEKTEKHNPVNLALNRPYTLNIKPNYDYCTDPADAVQLTNGEFSQKGSGDNAKKPNCFWTDKRTVGFL